MSAARLAEIANDLPGRDRKAEHIRLALDPKMQLGADFFAEYGFEHQALTFVVGETFLGPVLLFLHLVTLFWFWSFRGAANTIKLIVAPPIKCAFPATDRNKGAYAFPRTLGEFANFFW